MVWRLVLISALVAGCFTATAPECTVVCGDDGLCPDGMSCAEDGYCHAPQTPLCRCATCSDSGVNDAGAALTWAPRCEAGWCLVHPPFLGDVYAYYGSGDARLIVADDGLYGWTPRGWTVMRRERDLRFLTARSPSDLRVFSSTSVFRLIGTFWNSERLPSRPLAVTQFGLDSLMFGADRVVYRAGGGPFVRELSLPIPGGPLFATGTAAYLVDPGPPQLVIYTRSGINWVPTRFVPNGMSRVVGVVATPRTLFLLGSSDVFAAALDSLGNPTGDGGFILQGRGVVAAQVGAETLGVSGVGSIMSLSAQGTTLVGQLAPEIRSAITVDGGFVAGVRAFSGSTALWLTLNGQLWEVRPGTAGAASQTRVTTAGVAGGVDDDLGLSFVAGGRLYDSVDGIVSQSTAPPNITSITAYGGKRVVATSDGVFLYRDGNWVQLASGRYTRVSANASRIAAPLDDGGLLLIDREVPTPPLRVPGRVNQAIVTAVGSLYVSSGNRLLVEDGGGFGDVIAPTTAPVQSIAPGDGDQVVYLRGDEVCWVPPGTCVAGTAISSGSTLQPLEGAVALFGSSPQMLLLRGSSIMPETVTLPARPTAIWSARDGGLLFGTSTGEVYSGR